jgi:hypothetical protein
MWAFEIGDKLFDITILFVVDFFWVSTHRFGAVFVSSKMDDIGSGSTRLGGRD